MILQCPQCSTRFLVADHLVPPEGRMVKCGSCKHDWHVSPADNKATDTPSTVDSADFAAAVAEEMAHPSPQSDIGEPEPAPQPAAPKNLPAIRLTALPLLPLQIAAAVLLLGWLVSALYSNFYEWQNGPLASVYRVLGVVPTDGLRFDHVDLTRKSLGPQRTQFLLTGKVVNESPHARTIPLVHVALSGKDGEEIWSRDYEVNKEVAAGDEYPFRITNVETSFADKVAQVTMDMGNEMQLKFR